MTKPVNQHLARAVFRQDFRSFVPKAFNILQPHEEYHHNWHIDAISDCLQDVAEGRVHRQMVLMPPRSMKSLLCSVIFPVWYIGRNPGKMVLVASHHNDLAVDLSNKSRKLLSDPEVQEIFPTFKSLSKDSESEFVTAEGGGRKAVSVGGKVTGRGGHVLISDDLLDASDADNEAACQATNEWYDDVYSTRTNNPADFAMILVMQRLSVFDPAQHLLQQEHWETLTLPAIATKNESIPLGGGKTHDRKKGDLLHAVRYPEEYLETQKRKMGKRSFGAQFQQCPVLDGAGVVDLSQIRRFDKLPVEYDARFFSIDAASGIEGVSYSVILACQITNGRLYVFGHFRGKPTIPELARTTLKGFRELDIDHLVIEDASGGTVLLQILDEHFMQASGGDVEHWRELMKPVHPNRNKILRMEKQLRHVEDGRLYFPTDKPWLSELESEIRNFPAGKFDDQVDALSQALLFFNWYMDDGLHGRGHWPKVA